MDFRKTAEQAAVQRLFFEFSEHEVRPRAHDLDKHPQFPEALFLKLGKLGFFGMRYPAPEGLGADLVSYLLAVEELARASLSFAATATMQSLMGTYFIHKFSTGSTRERLLGPLFRGEKVGTICMTEPNAGSDLLAMTTRAEDRAGEWFVTGQKTWITAAPRADVFTVFARTADGGLSTLLVERGAPGLVVGRSIEKMGVKSSLTSEVSFDSTPAVLLGSPGQGGASLREILVEIRLMTGALSLGLARAALDDALLYAKERVQFKKPIAEFQAIQIHLAEMKADLCAARHLVEYGAYLSESQRRAGQPNDAVADDAAIAKLFASEAAARICDKAARILASYGFAEDYAIERYLRDVRFLLIGGGTSEILKVNIAKGMVKTT